MKELKGMIYEERMKRPWFFQLGEEEADGQPHGCLQLPHERERKEGADLSSSSDSS